jgi:hypothetical protein
MNRIANIHGGIVAALACLTMYLIFQEWRTTDLGFIDAASHAKWAFFGLLLVGGVYMYESGLSYPPQLMRMTFVWPFALVAVWWSFFTLLEGWGENISIPSSLLYFEESHEFLEYETAWYASTWVLVAGSIAALIYAFLIAPKFDE